MGLELDAASIASEGFFVLFAALILDRLK